MFLVPLQSLYTNGIDNAQHYAMFAGGIILPEKCYHLCYVGVTSEAMLTTFLDMRSPLLCVVAKSNGRPEGRPYIFGNFIHQFFLY